MTLTDISRALGLESLTPAIAGGPAERAAAAIDRAHCSDLLSDVLANAPAGGMLLTIQVHMNVIAVALHAGLSAVVFTSGMVPDEAVRAKAAGGGPPAFHHRGVDLRHGGQAVRHGAAGRGEPRA